MSPRTQTALVLIVTVLWLIAWDVWIIYRYGQKASISYVIMEVSGEPVWLLVVGIGIGILLGHWFWPLKS